MKQFTKNGKIQKIIIILFILILLFEFIIPNVSNADSGWGGTLFLPIQELSLAIGDVGEAILNLFIYGDITPVLTLSKENETFLDKLNNFRETIVFGIGGIIIKNIVSSAILKFQDDDFVNEIELPTILVTPDRIFSNQIYLLDVNIIQPNEYKDDEGNEKESVAAVLQSTISSWYSILRNIAIVAALSMLVYIGIRILISTAAEEKSKYKQMLTDWLVGLCLIFLMHYIMSFALLITDKFTELLDINNEGIRIESEDIVLSDYNADNEKVKDIVEKYNGDTGTLKWNTDMAGYVRFNAQVNINSNGAMVQMGYTLMYLVLVIYTYIFLFKYLKRLLIIVFLTLVAPIVALSYSFDKASDGKAQAFNMWLKEYFFNLLLQPMHLILYTVLIGSSMSLVVDHPIYAIVALGFLLEAEKLFRKMFKFDNASTTSEASSGAFTGAMVMHGINSLIGKVKHKNGSKEGNGRTKNTDGDDSRLRFAENRSADDPNQEDNFIDRTLGVENSDNYNADQESETDNGNQDSNNTSEGNNNDNYEEFLNDINNPENHTLDFGNNVGEDPSLDDPYYKYMPPDEYDDEGNYIGKSENSNFMKDDNDNKPADNSVPEKIILKNKPKRTKTSYVGAAARLYLPKIGKGLVKGGAMAVGAGTLGMVATAAALADKNKNLLTYGIAGMSGGAVIGKIASDKAFNIPQSAQNIDNRIQNAKNDIVKEALKNDPKEYKQYLNDKADQEFLNNKKIKQKYIDGFGENRANEMMNSAIKYRKHGVTNDDIIIKAMKQKSKSLGEDPASDGRIVAAKLALNVNNEKDMETIVKRLKDRGVQEKNIKEQEKFIRNIRGLI